MKKKYDILTPLDICADLLMPWSDMPVCFGQTETLLPSYQFVIGGSACIFACQAAKLGLSVCGIGRVGFDFLGEYLLGAMHEVGVSIDFIDKIPEMQTSLSVCLCRPDGDRAILTSGNTVSGPTPVQLSDKLLASSSHLHISSFFLMPDLLPRLIEVAKQKDMLGLTISLDTNWDPSEEWRSGLEELLPYIDLFLPNEAELLAITGKADVETALAALPSQIPVVAVKMGSRGALLFQQGRMTYSPALPVKVADTVGAGDSFDAGLIYGYLNHLELKDALDIGCWCGSLSTTRPGGTEAQPMSDMLQHFLSGRVMSHTE